MERKNRALKIVSNFPFFWHGSHTMGRHQRARELMRSIVAILLLGIAGPALAAPAREGHSSGFTAEDRNWWALQAVTDPPVPDVGTGWARNPIDRFVARKLADAGLEFAPEADRHELVRRVYFDLHGLPPTPEQVAEFVGDTRPDAWPRLIRQLLDSPRYGERWAQHWLDVVRYAESDGYREDAFRPAAHVYRDYVIASLNDDKPYDRFVREQLAGDELAPDDPEVFIGTAFLRHGVYEWNQRDVRMHRDLIVHELTRVTGEAFLGLGIGCAQCHDHKFDPLLQKDYYALQAFLSSTAWPQEAWLVPRDEVAAYQREVRAWEEATQAIRDEMHQLVQPAYDAKIDYTIKQFPEDIQAIYYKPAIERTPYEEQLAYLVERQVLRVRRAFDPAKELKGKPEELKRYEERVAALKSFDDRKPKPPPEAFTARDVGRVPARTWMKARTGDVEVEPAFLTLLALEPPGITPLEDSTGRRTALADWIASPDNPLSTRVIVNRIWQHHFGQGLVATPNDFGQLGEPPSHPELLDWLTQRFLEGGWRLKPLHELILNSATYRQSARREPSHIEVEIDSANRLLWRFPPRRLSAEQVRDAMLAVSGELKPRGGGPSVEGGAPYRSVYVKKLRNSPDDMLQSFDAPAGFDSAPDRVATTTPLQSLLLINGDWVLERAGALAGLLLGDRSQMTAAEVRRAYQRVFNRDPSDDEITAALDFCAVQSETVTGPRTPRDPFPNETGLRPLSPQFREVNEVPLGDKALWIQPGSRFERLQATDLEFSEDDFTIEAVANLDRIYSDASVNTLVSRWNGQSASAGWAFGVTSQESRYQPRNVIVQLIGEDFQGNLNYDVVASDLRFPLGKPVYFAAAIAAVVPSQDRTTGRVTFHMKDLSDPDSPLESRTVETSVVGHIQNPALKFLVGGRDSKGHLWDGQLARLTISRGVLPRERLLVGAGAGEAERILDWVWVGDDGEEPAAGSAWLRPIPSASQSTQSPELLGAVTDFCHALLSANEFLYLH